MTKVYIPQCDPSMKQFVKQNFRTLDDGVEFYKKYALACGFDIRHGTKRKSYDGSCITLKYIFCNKEGVKHAADMDIPGDIKKQHTVSFRVDCKARIVFKFVGLDGYMVTKFVEAHSHTLVPEAYRYFMKMNSKLDVGHQKFVMDCAKANIGAMRSYKMMKIFAGSYSSIGCSSVQVKNFSRDLKAYVIGADAQMIIDKLYRKRELCSTFYFEFEVDESDHLKSLFWADPIARINFCAFGDVVSFDATYSTNKYNMIFAPFTTKDNHGKCVTLVAALMTGESIESYAWVFKQFKKCMIHEPAVLITDQDPTIKVAFKQVFQHTRHRLCMLHIMSKITEKWSDIMNTFTLVDESWFISMYNIREMWIPAYFRDLKMGGLFMTTSPSESENSFFRMHMSQHSNLLQFFMYFESTLDSQRHNQAKLNNQDLSCCSDFRTLLQFEKHALMVYTRSIFNQLQDDIERACYSFHLTHITEDELSCLYQVDDCTNGIFNVKYDKVAKDIVYSCKRFVMIGLLCCHVFFAFKDLKFESIPQKYIVSRWTKQTLFSTGHVVADDVLLSCAAIYENRFTLYDIVSEFYSCLSMDDGDLDRSNSLLQAIRDVKDSFKSGGNSDYNGHGKKRLFEEYNESSMPEQVNIKSPVPVKTKGSDNRIKSDKEKNMEKMKKPLRKCSACGEKCHRDARNCPGKK
ncbi:hypothetical protein C2S53_004342 [Perilla frutescens var. hirtella]|uniref:Protein FAR1-RELATED SEQUENCE n=1 Tax=Perilla frutescens var. hirtella TaxID=608512 RepID=A0AAD4INQ7_PERFH|nr:hypothetical protein C2S53_004342 [Perilla frutescens var. hirtella]